ncbi:MAG: efflux RND transporter permease subunit, partial [Pseudomonadota bacterium]
TPLEQEINGVEGMLYLSSQATADGSLTITITFALGTDLDQAQVLVQNRVARAEPRLPLEVRQLGVTTQKNSPDLMLVVHVLSPDATYDQLYIANYVNFQIRDVLARVGGVGNITIFGGSEYAMRVWLDPDKLASLELTAGDVLASLRAQNVQIASGSLGAEPMADPIAFTTSVQTQGRLSEPEEFGNIIVEARDGQVIRLRDVGRVELGAQSYTSRSYLNDDSAVAVAIFQRPGTNALETAEEVLSLMEGLSAEFPDGLTYDVVYNPTAFVEESINEVYKTTFEAVALVILVIFVFLQSLRASVIPIIAIPISLIGTFAVMSALGFSLNNLSLFGIVLAIGIVVDDAIVVIENVDRNLREGLSPREAAHRTMDEVGGAVVSMSLVLVAVFVPSAFVGGISGQFYQQFAVTIAVATIISAFVSLTLSPALAALIIKPHAEAGGEEAASGSDPSPIDRLFGAFNRMFEKLEGGYGALVGRLTKIGPFVLAVYAGLIALTAVQLMRLPTGFIPPQDQGYFIAAFQLPPGSSLARTDAVVNEAVDIILDTPGVSDAVAFAGFDGATFTNATNAATIFTPLDDFEERHAEGLEYDEIQLDLNRRLSQLDEAFVVVIAPPPVRGIGNSGGFRLMLQDRAGLGLVALKNA